MGRFPLAADWNCSRLGGHPLPAIETAAAAASGPGPHKLRL